MERQKGDFSKGRVYVVGKHPLKAKKGEGEKN